MKPEIGQRNIDRDPPQEDYRQYDRDKLSELGLNPEEIESLEAPEGVGSTGLVYFIDREDKKMAIKKGIAVDPDLNARREFTFLKLLKMRGGNKVAPEPYFYNQDRNILITERIEGESVQEISDDDLVKIARVLGRVHGPEFKKPGIPFHKRKEMTQHDRLIEQVNFLENWFDEVGHFIRQQNFSGDDYNHLSDAVQKILNRIRDSGREFNNSSFSLIHYDLNPGNIFKDRNGNILFLDWRQASIGDRATDVAKLFYKNYLDEEQQNIFFDAYLMEIDDPQIRQRVEAYYPLVRLGSLLWRLRFLSIDIKEHPEMSNNINLDLVRARLNDDYQYLISASEEKD